MRSRLASLRFSVALRRLQGHSNVVKLMGVVTDEVDSVATEAALTSRLRMGGDGLGHRGALMVEAFIDSTPEVDNGGDLLDVAAVERGRQIYNRPDVGCAECHAGELHTDNLNHSMFGLDAVNTPSLIGVSATGPYLHDGSAKSLREVLELAAFGLMGDTSMLSVSEMDDLELYLLSL